MRKLDLRDVLTLSTGDRRTTPGRVHDARFSKGDVVMAGMVINIDQAINPQFGHPSGVPLDYNGQYGSGRVGFIGGYGFASQCKDSHLTLSKLCEMLRCQTNFKVGCLEKFGEP